MLRLKRKKDYIVYDTITDLPVAIGNIDECARATGSTPLSLRTATTRYFSGERAQTRYVLYDLDKLIEGYYLED